MVKAITKFLFYNRFYLDNQTGWYRWYVLDSHDFHDKIFTIFLVIQQFLMHFLKQNNNFTEEKD